MKTFIRHLLLITILATAPMAMAADKKESNKRPDPAKRENFAKAQAEEIAKKLELNSELTAKFTETYLKCQKEMWQLNKGEKPSAKPNEMTEEQAKAANEAQLKNQESFLSLRKKYYEEYSKFLTQKQIFRANQIERRMMDRMMQKRKPENNRPANSDRNQRRQQPKQAKQK